MNPSHKDTTTREAAGHSHKAPAVMKGDRMQVYITTLEACSGATLERLSALSEELSALGCQMQASRCDDGLRLEIPGDLVVWIKTGGLAGLLANYRDAVRWAAPFTAWVPGASHHPRTLASPPQDVPPTRQQTPATACVAQATTQS